MCSVASTFVLLKYTWEESKQALLFLCPPVPFPTYIKKHAPLSPPLLDPGLYVNI